MLTLFSTFASIYGHLVFGARSHCPWCLLLLYSALSSSSLGISVKTSPLALKEEEMYNEKDYAAAIQALSLYQRMGSCLGKAPW